MTEPEILKEPLDFSLVLGGPIFQLFRKSHLAGDGLELLHRRLIVIAAVAWLPLLLLTTLSSSAGNVGRLSFFHDVEVHVRFLIALPVLIAAELIVHSRTRPVVRCFVERRMVLPQDLNRFHSAIDSAVRLRNSVPAEVGLLILVYTIGLWLWHIRVTVDGSTWPPRIWRAVTSWCCLATATVHFRTRVNSRQRRVTRPKWPTSPATAPTTRWCSRTCRGSPT